SAALSMTRRWHQRCSPSRHRLGPPSLIQPRRSSSTSLRLATRKPKKPRKLPRRDLNGRRSPAPLDNDAREFIRVGEKGIVAAVYRAPSRRAGGPRFAAGPPPADCACTTASGTRPGTALAAIGQAAAKNPRAASYDRLLLRLLGRQCRHICQRPGDPRLRLV